MVGDRTNRRQDFVATARVVEIRSGTVVELLKVSDLTTLVVLCGVAAHAGLDGGCRASIPRLATRLRRHRVTVAKYIRKLALFGFLTEHPVRGATVRRVVERDGPLLRMDAEHLSSLGDAAGLLLLLQTRGEFETKLDDLARDCGVHRDTLDTMLEKLQHRKLLTVRRVSRSHFSLVPAGPFAGTVPSSEKSDGVRRADSASPPLGKWQSIAAHLKAKLKL
jgi:hypothetical protein